ncbi:MAG: cytochrome c [Chitinophagaceae bacterium]|nr:cytochrome c [Chitinophagaceae bacterium]
MRRRLFPVNVVIAALLFILLSLEPDPHTLPLAVRDRGETLYNQECQSCHGNEQEKRNTLSKTKLVMGPQKPLIKTLLNGSGVSNQTGNDTSGIPMHAYSYLTDQQLSDVLTFIRNSFGNTAKPITPADIKKVRLAKEK